MKWLYIVGTLFILQSALANALIVGDPQLRGSAFAGQTNYFDINITNDRNVSTTVSFALYDNGSLKNFKSEAFDVNQSKIVEVPWAPSTTGTHTIDLNISDIGTGETVSKTQQVSVTTHTEYDFLVQGEDIDANGLFVVGKTTGITALVRNDGNSSGEITVRAYHSQETLETLLASEVITVNANTAQTINFSYTPGVAGVDSIIVIADALNNYEEANEQNNRGERTFTVSYTESGSQNYTTDLFLRNDKKDCVVVFSNGERYYHKSIKDDGGESYEDFELVDRIGNTIFSAHGFTGDEFVKPGTTVKMVNVSPELATVLLVYSFSNPISYSSCEVNIQDIVGKLGTCEAQLTDLQERSGELGSEKNACLTIKDDLELSLNTCRTEKSSCESNKNTCETAIAVSAAQQTTQIGEARLSEQRSCDNQISLKENEIKTVEEEKGVLDISASTGWLMFFATIVIFAFLYHKGAISL